MNAIAKASLAQAAGALRFQGQLITLIPLK